MPSEDAVVADNADPTNDWTVTEAGAGTRAVADADGGVLVVTNAAADDDHNFIQQKKETFTFVAGKKLFFKSRFKVSDVTQSDFIMGLQIIDVTPLDVTDGVYFRKDDGDAALDFYVEKDNVSDSISGIPVTISNDTYFTVGFYYDGASAIYYFFNDVVQGNFGVTYRPTTELAVSFVIQNGEAVAKSMSIDYIFVAKER